MSERKRRAPRSTPAQGRAERDVKLSASRDRHRLYEASVQCPSADIQFFDRVYKDWNGRKPRVLREDFCGTAAIAAEWVQSRSDNRAIGVDLDGPTLEWGRRRHIVPLPDEAAARIELIQADVRAVRRPKADVVAALNFSYFVFHTRDGLREYLRAVRTSLAPDGIFLLDIFGGWEAQAQTTEKKPKAGFTYLWEQKSFDPITHLTRFHIHFRFRDGSTIQRAFTYDWRLWSVPEVREILLEAGFRRTVVYWEGTNLATGEGNGIFRRAERAPSTPGWIAYIAAGMHD